MEIRDDKRDEDAAWHEVFWAMKKAHNLSVTESRAGSLPSDGEILAAAKDCKHRPDGVRCGECRSIVEKAEACIQKARFVLYPSSYSNMITKFVLSKDVCRNFSHQLSCIIL